MVSGQTGTEQLLYARILLFLIILLPSVEFEAPVERTDPSIGIFCVLH